MRRQFLATLVFAAALSQAATIDTTWQYTPYSNEVTDLKVFHPGTNPTIWIGTHHGVVRIQGTDTLWLHPTNSKLPNEYISGSALSNVNKVTTVTALDSVGNYWIGYRNQNKLVRITPYGTVTVLDSSAKTPWNTINGITSSASVLYVGNSDGRVIEMNFEGTAWNELLPPLETNSGITLTALAAGWNDTLLWTGYDGNANGNLKYLTKAKTIGYFADGSNKITAPVYDIWIDSADNAKFIRTTTSGTYGDLANDTLLLISSSNQSGMIAVLNKGTAGQFTAFPSLTGYPTFIKNDTLWNVSSSRGYVDFQQEKSSTNLIPVYAKGLSCGAKLAAEVTLYGGPTGLYGFQAVNDLMNLVARPYGPSLAGNGIVGATHGAGGALWIATDSALYYRDDATSLKSIYTPTSATLRAVGRDSSGILWIGQSNGIFSWKSGTATLGASSDTLVAMTFATNYDWFLTKTSAGKFILAQLYQNSKWSALPLTGLGADSAKITKLRATSDGQLYALANGIIYWYSGLNWSKTPAVAFVTGNGNAGNFYDIDLAQNNVWSQYMTASQYQANSWGVASASATVASGIFNPAFSGGVFAASDTSAWFFNQASTASFTGSMEDAGLYRVSSSTKGIVESYTSDSALHAGKAASGEHIFSDNNGGLWVVMKDGVSRMKVTTSGTGTGISSHASSLTSPLASLRAGKLELSLTSAAAVRIQVLDLNGRVLERQDLTLAAGTHAVALSKGQGLRLVRIQAGDQSQTLRLPSL